MPRDVAWAGAMPGGVDATSRAAARTPEGSSFMVSGEPRGGAHHAPPGAVKALSPKASGLNADATRAECGRGRHRSSGQPAQHVHGWLGQVPRVEVQPRRTALEQFPAQAGADIGGECADAPGIAPIRPTTT